MVQEKWESLLNLPQNILWFLNGNGSCDPLKAWQAHEVKHELP